MNNIIKSPAYNSVGDFFMSKESFKTFVRNKPELAKYVQEKNISWQSIYELYELYGENSDIWKDYSTSKFNTTINDVLNTIKNIDIEKLQSGIENIQNTISLVQNLGSNKDSNTYEPTRTYQHIDD